MGMKKIFSAAAIAATVLLGAVGVSAPAEAKVHVFVGGGYGYGWGYPGWYGPGPGYYDPYWGDPGWRYHRHRPHCKLVKKWRHGHKVLVRRCWR